MVPVLKPTTHSDTQPSSLTPVPALCFKSHNPGYKPHSWYPVLKPTTHGVLDFFAAAILSFLARHPDHHGPLFIHEDGSPLTKYQLVKQVRLALSQKGIEVNIYSGHRFWIGAATTAATVGIPEATIKTLGRWECSAYIPLIYSNTKETTNPHINIPTRKYYLRVHVAGKTNQL